jgi:alpha-galactosidase
VTTKKRFRLQDVLCLRFLLCAIVVTCATATQAQFSEVARQPYLGWSSYSQHTIAPTQAFLTQDSIIVQS